MLHGCKHICIHALVPCSLTSVGRALLKSNRMPFSLPSFLPPVSPPSLIPLMENHMMDDPFRSLHYSTQDTEHSCYSFLPVDILKCSWQSVAVKNLLVFFPCALEVVLKTELLHFHCGGSQKPVNTQKQTDRLVIQHLVAR